MDLERLNRDWGLEARTVVVPGGAGVLGREMASALVRCGANVVVLDRDLSGADSLQERWAAGPGVGRIIQGDVLDRESLLEARQAAQEEFGAIYGLINAAGGNIPQATTGPDRSFFDLPKEALQGAVDLNLLGSILPCQVFGRGMAERGEGVIINIASMAGYRPLTRTIAYSASKAAVANLTQWLAVHMAQEYSPGIRVNALAPGFFHTAQNHYLLFERDSETLTPRGRAIIAHTPMGRFGKPQDLLGCLLWLLSPLSAFVTGAVIPIDGGFSAFSGV